MNIRWIQATTFAASLLCSTTIAQAGALAIHVQGNVLADDSGHTVQLRGVNYSGFEFTAIEGFDPQDPSGAQAGQAGGPNWSAIASWHANAVRIPLNEASGLGGSCTQPGSSATRNPDPGQNYQSAVKTQVSQANAAGLYVILDLHWAAPGTTCPMLQTQMADQPNSIAFWTSVANAFKGNPAVVFELYNEPYFYGLTGSESEWPVLMKGGTLSFYPAINSAGNYQNVNTSWTVADMQSMLDAVRATGATNVVLVGGVSYNNDLSDWLAIMPTDSLGQLGASWHPYPPEQYVSAASASSSGLLYRVGDTLNLPQPNTVYVPAVVRVSAVNLLGGITGLSVVNGGSYLQTSVPTAAVTPASSTSALGFGAQVTLSFSNLGSNWSVPANWPTVKAISARVPVVITETGEHNATGTSGAPFLQQLLPYADAAGWSVLGWTWDVWQNPDNVLITNVSGSPTPGYGQVFHDWMTGTAWQ